MKQFLLASVLILGAIGTFAGGKYLMPNTIPAPLGDLTALQSIVTDVQAKVAAGDLAGATTRVKDLETAWDDAQPTMQPMNPEAWGRVDGATDAVLKSLRAATPDAATASAALVALTDVMADPGKASTVVGGVTMIGDIAVTDAAGHALPCESMLKQITAAVAAKAPTGDVATQVTDETAKATERCNADDDTAANAHSAAALQLLATN